MRVIGGKNTVWRERWLCHHCTSLLEVVVEDIYVVQAPRGFLFWKWQKREVCFTCPECEAENPMPEFSCYNRITSVGELTDDVKAQLPTKDEWKSKQGVTP